MASNYNDEYHSDAFHLYDKLIGDDENTRNSFDLVLYEFEPEKYIQRNIDVISQTDDVESLIEQHPSITILQGFNYHPQFDYISISGKYRNSSNVTSTKEDIFYINDADSLRPNEREILNNELPPAISLRKSSSRNSESMSDCTMIDYNDESTNESLVNKITNPIRPDLTFEGIFAKSRNEDLSPSLLSTKSKQIKRKRSINELGNEDLFPSVLSRKLKQIKRELSINEPVTVIKMKFKKKELDTIRPRKYMEPWCSKCKESFPYVRSSNCAKCELPISYKCLICSTVKHTKRSISNHVRSVCKPKFVYSCNECEYSTTKRESMIIQHIQKRHMKS